MALAPSILTISIPPIIDISKGPQEVIFSVQVALGDAGLPIRDVFLQLEGAPRGLSFINGRVIDSFNDATPTFAKVAFTFDGTTPPGIYPISRLSIFDTSGVGNVYSASQLKAMGWPTGYTVINSAVPSAPTLSIQAFDGGLIDGNKALLSGLAAPGSTVSVSAYRNERIDNSDMSRTVQIGTTQADADGKWSLATNALADGRYTDVKATATVSGNTSPYSAPQEFKVSYMLPSTPILHAVLGMGGHTDSATPFISGFTSANAVVELFDGDRLVGSSVADSGGWFGMRTSALAAGKHDIKAVASNLSGGSSPSSAMLSVVVDTQPGTGIDFEIGSYDNPTGIAVDQQLLKNILADVGAIISSMVEGTQRISLAVDVRSDPAGQSYAYAAAGASRPVIDPTRDMPVVSNASLTLSSKFAADLIAFPHEKMRGYVNVLAHEMLHVLGFNSTRDPVTNASRPGDFKFGELSELIDGKLYFTGVHASAANGGAVELANKAHLAHDDDIMYTSGPIKFSDASYFDYENPTAPLSNVDLAILKDLGYTVKHTIAARDGHTFLAGSGKEGYGQVEGTPGLDTVFINLPRSAFTGAWKDTKYVLTQHAAPAVYNLDSIERIRFADTTLAIDLDGGAGQVYRLYQAVFGRTPDAGGLGFWIGHIDRGMLLSQAADAFVASAEFKRLYGESPSPDEIVTKLYANVLHRAPDQAGFDFWGAIIKKDPSLVEEVLVAFSESPENVAQVAKVIGGGFEYTPWS